MMSIFVKKLLVTLSVSIAICAKGLLCCCNVIHLLKAIFPSTILSILHEEVH